jgi:hypothetical protein
LCLPHARPRPPPMFPLPMIAMFMTASLRWNAQSVRCAGGFRDGLRHWVTFRD